ncbi:MAG: hypothetical protein ABIG95_03460 [Candidatus Woesearchaeota archaeon]
MVKAKEILETWCYCGFVGEVVLDDILVDYYSECPKCHKRIFGFTCLKCGDGYCFPEESPNLDLRKNTWKCPSCKKMFEIEKAKRNKVEAYTKAPAIDRTPTMDSPLEEDEKLTGSFPVLSSDSFPMRDPVQGVLFVTNQRIVYESFGNNPSVFSKPLKKIKSANLKSRFFLCNTAVVELKDGTKRFFAGKAKQIIKAINDNRLANT